MRHWPPGQQLHQGKYLIEEILGGGGFGVTYRAQNRKEGKVVAIKTLPATFNITLVVSSSAYSQFSAANKFRNFI